MNGIIFVRKTWWRRFLTNFPFPCPLNLWGLIGSLCPVYLGMDLARQPRCFEESFCQRGPIGILRLRIFMAFWTNRFSTKCAYSRKVVMRRFFVGVSFYNPLLLKRQLLFYSDSVSDVTYC